jgi:predicted nucleic acid-binding Zn ribbon protein
MTTQSIQEILEVIAQQPQWQKCQQYHHVIKCWHQVVNDKIAQHTRILYLKRQVLWVATDSSVWAQNLSLQRYTLVKKLNQLLDDPDPLRDIRFSPALWNETKKKETNLEETSDSLQDFHRLNGEAQQSSQLNQEVSQTLTPQSALSKWLEVIRRRSQFLPLCPICQCPTPEEELKRWKMCGHCEIKQHKNS